MKIMASGRFLSVSVAEDDKLSRLSMQAELIYIKAIPHLDRDGMISGKPGFLWAKVCPLREELFGETKSIIDEWVNVGLVVRFDTDEGPALFFPGFQKNNKLPHYERERPSRFPPPPGFTRTKNGLVPPPDNSGVLDQVQDKVLDQVRKKEQKKGKVQMQEQEQEQEQDQDQDQDKDKDHHAPVARHDDDDDEATQKLKDGIKDIVRNAGVLPTPATTEFYLTLIEEYGWEPFVRGMSAAVEQGKQAVPKYVQRCTMNVALGNDKPQTTHKPRAGEPKNYIPDAYADIIIH